MSAENGNVEATFLIAIMYEVGQGTNVNYEKAVEYYEKGCDKGHIDSIINLANLYAKGKGVKIDMNKALSLLEIAVEKESTVAMRNIAVVYRNGIYRNGIDYIKSIFYFTKAANLGDTNAVTILGQMYELGIGTLVDIQKVLYYWSLTADKNVPSVMCHHAVMLLNHGMITTDEFLLKLKKATKTNDKLAFFYYAEAWEYQFDKPNNIKKSLKYYKNVAQCGIPAAMRKCADLLVYEINDKTYEEYCEALSYIILAYQNGEKDAITFIYKLIDDDNFPKEKMREVASFVKDSSISDSCTKEMYDYKELFKYL